MPNYLWVILPITAAVVMYALFIRPSLVNLMVKRRNPGEEALVWEDRGPTPRSEEGFSDPDRSLLLALSLAPPAPGKEIAQQIAGQHGILEVSEVFL